MARFIRLASLAAALLLPLAAQARNTEVFVPAESATRSEHARGYLLDIPYYLKGQPGAPNGKPLLTVTTQQSTRGAFRSDQASCRVAFLTALRELQREARRAGGDAAAKVPLTFAASLVR
jgi:hypothetical protein